MKGAVGLSVGLLLLLICAVGPAQGFILPQQHSRRMSQVAAAPSPVGDVCSNGLVCPQHQRCDVTMLAGNDGTQKVIQCLCVTGYNGPECPLPYSTPPAPTAAAAVSTPPAGLSASSPVAVAPAAVGDVCSNGLICPAHQRCDVTHLSGNDGTQKLIQCLCVTGYNGPECPQFVSGPPQATNGAVAAPSPPRGTTSSAAATAATSVTSASSSAAPKDDSSKLGVGPIVGIVVGCVVAVGLAVAGVLYARRRRRAEQKAVEFQSFHRAHHSLNVGQQPGPPSESEV